MELLGFVGNLSPTRKIPLEELAEELSPLLPGGGLAADLAGLTEPIDSDAVEKLSTALGGGAVQTHQEIMGIGGGAVAVTVAALPTFNTPLHFVYSGFGDEMFDLTDPAAPVVITPGVYSVSVIVRPQELMTEGARYEITLHMDALNSDAVATMTSAPAGADIADNLDTYGPLVSLNLTWYMPADAIMTLVIFHNDPKVGGIDFAMEEACIQRLS